MFIYMHYLACCRTHHSYQQHQRESKPELPDDACESFMWGQCESSGKYFVGFENGTKVGL
jgi:hypothetical protein